MHYVVNGEFIERTNVGKTPEESAMYAQQVTKPSFEALWKLAEERKVIGGFVAGTRECTFIVNTDSNDEVGRLLRSLPFWGTTRWRVSPLQSFQSALDQYREANQQLRAMDVES